MRLRVHRMVITSIWKCRHCKLNRLDSVFTTTHSVLLGGTWGNHSNGKHLIQKIVPLSCEASVLYREDPSLRHIVSRCCPALAFGIPWGLGTHCSALLFESEIRSPLFRKRSSIVEHVPRCRVITTTITEPERKSSY